MSVGLVLVTPVGNVSFSVHGRETLALVGDSVCGTTTNGKAIVQLLRSLAILQPEVNFNGRDPSGLDDNANALRSHGRWRSSPT